MTWRDFFLMQKVHADKEEFKLDLWRQTYCKIHNAHASKKSQLLKPTDVLKLPSDDGKAEEQRMSFAEFKELTKAEYPERFGNDKQD